MQPRLPTTIADYFEANARFDLDAMLAPFADDAQVHDERQTHRGRAAIREWIDRATIGVGALAKPLAITGEGGDYIVSAEVSGNFPGSPVTLAFRFTLAGGRIARLEIR